MGTVRTLEVCLEGRKNFRRESYVADDCRPEIKFPEDGTRKLTGLFPIRKKKPRGFYRKQRVASLLGHVTRRDPEFPPGICWITSDGACDSVVYPEHHSGMKTETRLSRHMQWIPPGPHLSHREPLGTESPLAGNWYFYLPDRAPYLQNLRN